MNRLILTCCVLVSMISSLSAAGRQVAFRTLCIQRLDALKTLIIPGKNPQEGQEVELFTDISPVIKGYFSSNKALFYTESAGPDGKPVRKLVAKGNLGKSKRQIFVFIATGKKEKLRYKVMCYDDDISSFGLGNIRAINMAPVPVRFVIAGKFTPSIPPGKFAQFPHSKKVNAYNIYPVVVEFLGKNGKWVKGQSVGWKATNRRREIVVTMINKKFSQPTVRMYTDFPPWLKTPDKE